MKRFLLATLIFISCNVSAAPKIEGTVSELQGYLDGVTEVVQIEGTAISKVSSDKAVIINPATV
jgi:hypothetical protein